VDGGGNEESWVSFDLEDMRLRRSGRHLLDMGK
jgi:hypothetical protein